jgi:quercetin dioxygenase-like cupin family protein
MARPLAVWPRYIKVTRTSHIERRLSWQGKSREKWGPKNPSHLVEGAIPRTVGVVQWLAADVPRNGSRHAGAVRVAGAGRTKRQCSAPHIHHREDETFYVLEGEITFSIGDRTIKATPGTMVFAPRDVVHSFTIDSEQVRILVMSTPAGVEDFFKECSVPAPSMTLPPPTEVSYSEIQKMMALAPKTASSSFYQSAESMLPTALGSRPTPEHGSLSPDRNRMVLFW